MSHICRLTGWDGNKLWTKPEKIRLAEEWAGDDKKYKQNIKKKPRAVKTAKRGQETTLAEVEKGRNTSAKKHANTYSLVCCQRSTGRSWRMGGIWSHPLQCGPDEPSCTQQRDQQDSEQSLLSLYKETHPCSSRPPTTVISMSSQAHGPAEEPQWPAWVAAKSTGGHWSLL